MSIKKHLSYSLLAISAASLAPATQAANWLMLQGTEPAGAAGRAKLWGFIQPEYQATDGTKLKAGPYSGQDAIFNTILPNRETESQFNLRRARFGVRGQGFPLDNNTNYFFLAEAGNNGITRPGGGTGSVKLTDASITLNHLEFARFRVGQFKTPGAEEGLMAIHVFNYVNFTNVTNGVLLERFLKYDGSGTFVNSSGSSDSGHANGPLGPVGAFRDIGVQMFQTFKKNDWEHSYAIMIGNGNGITRSDNNDSKDLYLYWSSEKVYGGKGGRRQGWKTFAWYQKGKRTLTLEQGTATSSDDVTQDFDRKRWGVGTTYLKGKYRAGAEYIAADGMIRNGTDGGAVVGSISNNGLSRASLNVLPNDKADGWYLDFGYKIKPNIELDIRYDRYNRATEVAANERRFETATVGAQYFFNKKTRLIFNYEFRNAEAPNLAGSANPNIILDGMDNLASVQLLAIF